MPSCWAVWFAELELLRPLLFYGTFVALNHHYLIWMNRWLVRASSRIEPLFREGQGNLFAEAKVTLEDLAELLKFWLFRFTMALVFWRALGEQSRHPFSYFLTSSCSFSCLALLWFRCSQRAHRWFSFKMRPPSTRRTFLKARSPYPALTSFKSHPHLTL